LIYPRLTDSQLEGWFIPALGVLAAISGSVFIVIYPPISVALVLGFIALAITALIAPLSTIFALLVLAPMRTLILTESSFQLPIDIGQLLVLVVVFVWAIHNIGSSRSLFRFRRSIVYVPLAVYLVVVGLTNFNALSLNLWMKEWLKWALMFGLMVVSASLIGNSQRRLEWVIVGLTLSGTANAIVGLYIYFGGSGALHLLVNGRFFRAFGTFGQPNPFGGFMGLIAPLAIMMAFGCATLEIKRWRKFRRVSYDGLFSFLFYGVSSVIIVLGLFASWSRGAWLGFVVSLCVICMLTPRKLWRGLLGLLFSGCVGLFLLNGGYLPTSISNRIDSVTEEFFTLDDVRAVDITTDNYPIVERLAHWQAALNMARSKPFWGVGFGNYEQAYSDNSLLNWSDALGHAHNYYLNVLAETGIVGFISYCLMLAAFVIFAVRSRIHPDVLMRSLSIGIVGTMVYLLIHSLTDNLYVNNVFIHIGVIFGVVAVLYADLFEFDKIQITWSPVG
jgi:O-antigen ligase